MFAARGYDPVVSYFEIVERSVCIKSARSCCDMFFAFLAALRFSEKLIKNLL